MGNCNRLCPSSELLTIRNYYIFLPTHCFTVFIISFNCFAKLSLVICHTFLPFHFGEGVGHKKLLTKACTCLVKKINPSNFLCIIPILYDHLLLNMITVHQNKKFYW